MRAATGSLKLRAGALEAALRKTGIDIAPWSPLSALARDAGAATDHVISVDTRQRRMLEAVGCPALGLGVILSPPHGLDLVWLFDSGTQGAPLVRYELEESGDHALREVDEQAVLDAIRRCLHLDTPTTPGDFTLTLDPVELSALMGLVDGNRERSLRSLLSRVPDPERTFSADDIAAALDRHGAPGDPRWLCAIAWHLSPVDLTTSADVLARGLDGLAQRGLLERERSSWRLTDAGRVLCSALSAPVAYSALHGHRADSSGSKRREHVAAIRTPESLWLMEFRKLDSSGPIVELRPVSGEAADLAFSQCLMEWRRAARRPARSASGEGTSAAPQRCHACGKPLRSGAKFCTTCGTGVALPAAETHPRACRACGTELRPGAKFCPSCGAAQGGVAAVAPSRADEDDRFAVILDAAGERKIEVVAQIKTLTGLRLREAKALVERAPAPVMEGMTRDAAERVKSRLEAVGAEVALRPMNTSARTTRLQ